MRVELNSRTFTNSILSVIAACLVLLVVHFYRLSIATPAHAQEEPSLLSTPTPRFGRSGNNAPVDLSNVAQMQDTAVAAATNEVAAANREIAAAIRELGVAVTGLGEKIGQPPAGAVPGAASVTVGAVSTPVAPAPVSTGGLGANIQVSPPRR